MYTGETRNGGLGLPLFLLLAAFQLQLGRVEVWKSWTISTFHPLPHTPSTGAVLHLWSAVTCSQHFNSLPSPANTGSTNVLMLSQWAQGTVQESWEGLGNRSNHPERHFPAFWSTTRLSGTQERGNLPLFPHQHMTRVALTLKWSGTPHSQLAGTWLSPQTCPVPLQVSHPTLKGWFLLALWQQNPWRCLFKGGYSGSFSIMCLSRLWSNGLEQLVQNDLKSCTSSSPGQVSFQDQSIW